MTPKLLVSYGSVRAGRQGISTACFVARACRDRSHDVFLVDPVQFPLPLLEKM